MGSRRPLRLLLLGALLGALAGALVAAATPSEPRAEALVVMQSADPFGPLFGMTAAEAGDVRLRGVTAATMFEIDPILDRVVAALPGQSREQLREAVEVRPVDGSYALRVVGRSATAEQAKQLVNVFASAFVAYQQESATGRLARARDALDAAREAAEDARRPVETVERAIDRLNIDALRATGGYTVVQGAREIGTEGRPYVEYAGAGAGAGLLLATLLLLLLRRREERLQGVAALERAFDRQALATLPRSRALSPSRLLDEPPPDARTAFDRLAELVVAELGDGGTVLLSSPRRFDGRTTVAWHLARALRRAGRRTLLLEADLSHPALADRLDVAGTPGLVGLLDAGADADPVVVPGADISADVPDLPDLIPAGDRLERPRHLLEAAALPELLRDLAGRYDVVVIDAPAGDAAAVLASAADLPLVVGRSGWTSPEDVRRYLDEVEDDAHGGRLVVNAV